MEILENINNTINGFIWGPIMLVLLIGTGIYLSAITGFLQITKIKMWTKLTFGSILQKKSSDDKNISPFQAVSTALASTVGTGNIAGVTTAIVAGGPGALFWMWFAAFFGMITKYSEVLVAIKFREKDKNGKYFGGPMYYLSKGAKMPWLGSIFALLVVLACFGVGNMTQTNSMANVVHQTFGVSPLITGIIVALLGAIIILGGIKRISAFAEKLVPLMCLFYIVAGLFIILINIQKVPEAIKLIFSEAFSLKQVGSGFMGYSISIAIRYGFARGIFSNEAGLGSAPIAHASTYNEDAVNQATWGIFEVFVDTFLVCSITGLIAIINLDLKESGLNGATLIAESFKIYLPGNIGSIILTIALILFSFTTFVGWSHYGSVSLGYLTKNNKIADLIFKIMFLIVGIIGATSELSLVWGIADTLNGLMSIPNLIGLLILSPIIAKTTKEYINK